MPRIQRRLRPGTDAAADSRAAARLRRGNAGRRFRGGYGAGFPTGCAGGRSGQPEDVFSDVRGCGTDMRHSLLASRRCATPGAGGRRPCACKRGRSDVHTAYIVRPKSRRRAGCSGTKAGSRRVGRADRGRLAVAAASDGRAEFRELFVSLVDPAGVLDTDRAGEIASKMEEAASRADSPAARGWRAPWPRRLPTKPRL